MSTLSEFVLCTKFKGELPAEYEVYDPAHWVLLARAMHALGDDEDKREAWLLLAEEDAEPDDELAYKLLGKWREELFGARTISIGGRGRRPKAEMDYIRFHLYVLTAQENPATVRSIFYRAVSKDLVPKTQSGYRTVQQQGPRKGIEENMQKLERVTFETSRAAEYFDRAGLSKQTGQVPSRFAEVVIKELADNALDAAEYARVAPEVEITAQEKGSALILSVADNGPGIPPKTVQKMLDFNTRTSDKAVYRSPTRGAQGNALKTIVGMPHALGSGKNPVLIDSQGARHLIKVVADPAGELIKERTVERCQHTTGTRVTVILPEATQFFSKAELLHWGRAVAVFNPHASVKVAGSGLDNYHGESVCEDLGVFYKPLTEKLTKYMPGDETSAHWYTKAELTALVFSYIRHARTEGGRDLPLGEFVRQFNGLKSTTKAREVCSYFPEISHLSDFEGRQERVASLLGWMQHYSKPPAHRALGRLGKEHILKRLENFYGRVERHRYKHFVGYLPSGLPYTFEFAVAEVEHAGDLFMGVNFSPTFGDPLGDLRIEGPKYEATGIGEFLEGGFAHPLQDHPDDPGSPLTAVVAHVVTPAPLFMEYGKTRLDLIGGK